MRQQEKQQAENVAVEEMRQYITTDMAARHAQQRQDFTNRNLMHHNLQKCREGLM
jgi:hypothetical protein